MKQNLNQLSDDALIRLFTEKNKEAQEAFGALVKRHYKSILSSLQYLKDPILAEDLLQEGLIKAMKAIAKGQYTEKGSFKAWIILICRNLAMDHFRMKKRQRTTSVPTMSPAKGEEFLFKPLIDDEMSHEAKIISLECDYDIEELIDLLPSDQREVVLLRHFHEFSFKEIVDYIGGDISINTVLGRMRYALVNLRKIIQERDKEKAVI